MFRSSMILLAFLMLAPFGQNAIGNGEVPTPTELDPFYTSLSIVRTRTTQPDNDPVIRTAYQADASFSGMTWGDRPASDGSFSIAGILESRNEEEEVRVSGAYFINSKGGVYSPHYLHGGTTFGGGLRGIYSEQNDFDPGAFIQFQHLSPLDVKFTSNIKEAKWGYGGDVVVNDQVLGRSSTTLTVGGDFALRHGNTAHDNISLALDIQHSWLESKDELPQNATLAVFSISGSHQLHVPWIYFQAGLGFARAYDDPLNEENDNRNGYFLSASLVFRTPIVVLPSDSDMQILKGGWTPVGGSSAGSNFFDTFWDP